MAIRMYFNSLFFFQANEFLECVGGSSSIYGLQPDTVSSLLITLLPPIENDYKPRYQMPNVETPSTEVKMRVLEMLLQALKENAGFQIPVVSGILSPTCMLHVFVMIVHWLYIMNFFFVTVLAGGDGTGC